MYESTLYLAGIQMKNLFRNAVMPIDLVMPTSVRLFNIGGYGRPKLLA